MKNKRNKLRYLYPNEWTLYSNAILNTKHFFWCEFLLKTGMRINEARTTTIKDINFDRKFIIVRKGKGNKQREVSLSTEFCMRLKRYAIDNKLRPEDTFGFPSTQYMDKMIKKYASKGGLNNPEDFCCHTFRKTHENYLCALGVNSMLLTLHMGHTIHVATQYYISQFLKPDEKQLIRSIMGDLFMVDNSTTIVNQQSNPYSQPNSNGQ